MVVTFGVFPLCVLLLAGCQRDTEAAQRERLAQWFSLGETRAFTAQSGCAAAVYLLVTDRVGSAMPVTGSVPMMRRALVSRGVAAVDLAGRGGDAVLVEMANHHRETGMAMRRAALEARACMDAPTEGAFRDALDDPRTVVAWEAENRTLMLIVPHVPMLIVAMGEG